MHQDHDLQVAMEHRLVIRGMVHLRVGMEPHRVAMSVVAEVLVTEHLPLQVAT